MKRLLLTLHSVKKKFNNFRIISKNSKKLVPQANNELIRS